MKRFIEKLSKDIDLEEGRSALQIRTSIAARVRSDFSEGRVVRIDGWVLSLTEARIAALAAV